MKIIIFSSFFYPHVGGTENYVLNLSKRISANHDIQIITCNTEHSPHWEEMNGFQVHRLDAWNFFGGRWPLPKITLKNFKIIRQVLSNSPNILVTNIRFYPLSLFGAIIARILRSRHIHIEHSSQTPAPKNVMTKALVKAYDLTLGRITVSIAHEVAGSSQAALNFARSLGASTTSSYIAYNGVDSNEFKDSQKNYKKILFVGRLIYPKGCHDLINAFKIISNEFLDVELLIAGNGPERDYLERLSRGFKIRFLGELDRPQLSGLYSECGIFVLPSYSESAPTSVLEAGAAGLIIIATDIAGISEVFNDSKCLFKSGDVNALAGILRQVLADPQKFSTEEFQLKVREHFNWDSLATKFEERLKL